MAYCGALEILRGTCRGSVSFQADFQVRQVKILSIAEFPQQRLIHDFCDAFARRAYSPIHGDVEDNGMSWDFYVDHVEISRESVSLRLRQFLLGFVLHNLTGQLAAHGTTAYCVTNDFCKRGFPRAEEPDTHMPMPSCGSLWASAMALYTVLK